MSGLGVGRLRALKRGALLWLLGGMVGLEMMEASLYSFASSAIMGGVGAAPEEYAAAATAYAFMSIATMLLQGVMVRWLGYRRFIGGALLLFALGGFAAGNAGSVNQLIAARALQGIGAGAFWSARILINLLVKPERRSGAIRVYLFGLLFGSAIGPLIASKMVEYDGWSWVFFASIGPALLLFLLALWVLPDADPEPDPYEKLQLGHLLAFIGGLVAVQLLLQQVRFDFFSHPLRLAMFGLLAFALFATFIYHQRRHPTPLLNLRLLGNAMFASGLWFYFMYYLLTTAFSYLFPQFAERGLGIDLTEVGWLMTLSSLIGVAFSLYFLGVMKKVRRRSTLVLAGFLVFGLACLWATWLPAEVESVDLLPMLLLRSTLTVLIALPLAGMTYTFLQGHEFSHGYRTRFIVRSLSMSFGTSLGAVLLQNRQAQQGVNLAANVNLAEPAVVDWLATLQRHFESLGYDLAQSHAAALGVLQQTLSRQALLLASQDLFTLLAALGMVAFAIVLIQRRLS
ncbi:MFS transporter [Neisseriaceae bacterium JH1-16]|nr:MFS transporter [Neisseriaceae bacterium JH1-16]